MLIIKKLIKYWVLAFIYPKPILGLFYLPRFLYHWSLFSRIKKIRITDSYPCLGDWTTNTPFDAHYFYQASWLARNLALARPFQHFDVGSDVRMIGVISAFIPTQFIDYRPLRVELSNLECTPGNILSLPIESNSLNSISCLHVVEHIGLGRYGDPINPLGSQLALMELSRLVAPGGRLYISVPVGRDRVCFNAHRVFEPMSFINNIPDMKLISFSLVDDGGEYLPDCNVSMANNLEYGCGMFVLEKKVLT
jgi:SAM-dependent methyltransferase